MALLDTVQNPNSVAVSTTTQVLVNGIFVGVVQSLEPTSTRATTPVRGIGIGDRIIERVWQVSDYSLSIQRMALFNKFMLEALGYNPNFRMLAELRFPIDIMESIIFPDNSQTRTTFYRGCYINNLTAPKAITGDIIIIESCTLDATSIDNGSSSPLNYNVGVV